MQPQETPTNKWVAKIDAVLDYVESRDREIGTVFRMVILGVFCTAMTFLFTAIIIAFGLEVLK